MIIIYRVTINKCLNQSFKKLTRIYGFQVPTKIDEVKNANGKLKMGQSDQV